MARAQIPGKFKLARAQIPGKFKLARAQIPGKFKLARAQIHGITKMLKLFLRTMSLYKSRWTLPFINAEHAEHLCVDFVLRIEGLSNVTLTP